MHLGGVRDLFPTDVDLIPVAFPTTHVPARLLGNRTLGNPVGPKRGLAPLSSWTPVTDDVIVTLELSSWTRTRGMMV